jgi:spore germination protein GerM
MEHDAELPKKLDTESMVEVEKLDVHPKSKNPGAEPAEEEEESKISQKRDTEANGTETEAETRRIQAALFYVAEDGMTLTPVSREVVYGATPAEQARRILEAQVAPPPDGRVSAIPAGTTVRAAYLTATGEAYVDLGGAIVSGHSGGSLDEALTVYAIVNALAANLPGVTTVQILVEGQEVDSLVGHLDLRHPLGRALDWVRKDPAS